MLRYHIVLHDKIASNTNLNNPEESPAKQVPNFDKLNLERLKSDILEDINAKVKYNFNLLCDNINQNIDTVKENYDYLKTQTGLMKDNIISLRRKFSEYENKNNMLNRPCHGNENNMHYNNNLSKDVYLRKVIHL